MINSKQFLIFLFATVLFVAVSCGKEDSSSSSSSGGGMASVSDSVSQKNVVQIAVGSKDHTTLVAAVQAADYVDSLANPGPFTVFAPTNDAFAKLPKGTVDELLKPDKKDDLKTVLEHHVYVGVLKAEYLKDGQDFGMADGTHLTVSVKNGKISIGGANILASVPASNGIVHVIDAVLVPQPATKN